MKLTGLTNGNEDNAAILAPELEIAEQKAWDSLARYKFWMFGYWAGVWVHLNRISGTKRPNPWRDLVHQARRVVQSRRGGN